MGLAAVAGESPKAPHAKLVPARSVFVLPTSPRDGRDPFFPESTRLFENTVAAKPAAKMVANVFSIKGFSVEHGRAMVIINNHTFAVGDEGDVRTSDGRMHLRCLEIRNGMVVIEVNGTRRELFMGGQ